MSAVTVNNTTQRVTVSSAGKQGAIGLNWRDDWTTATAYAVRDAVYHEGSSYRAVAAHTSGASTEPGVGDDWEDAWTLLVYGVDDPMRQSIYDPQEIEADAFDRANHTGQQLASTISDFAAAADARIGAALGIAGASPSFRDYTISASNPLNDAKPYAWSPKLAADGDATTGSTGGFWNLMKEGVSQSIMTKAGRLALAGMLALGSGDASAPTVGLKASGNTLQARLADDSGFASMAIGTSLQLGGTSAGFPMLKRNGAGMDLRLADDSGFAALAAASLALSGVAAGTVPLSIQLAAGQTANAWQILASDGTTGLARFTSGGTNFQAAGTGAALTITSSGYGNGLVRLVTLDGSAGRVQLNQSGLLGWGNGNSVSTTDDVVLRRGGAGILEQRDGANAQLYRLANTYTDAANNEMLHVGWGLVAANNAYIVTRPATTGSTRNLNIGAWNSTNNGPLIQLLPATSLISFVSTGVAVRWNLDVSTGHFYPGANNSYDLGASGAAARDAYVGRQLILGGNTVTASMPLISGTQTWNGSGITFAGLFFNFTDTISQGGSLLLQLQVGGVDRAWIRKDGKLAINGSAVFGGTTSPTSSIGQVGAGYIMANSTGAIGFTSTADASNSADTILWRGGAGILQLKNSTNAQALQIFNSDAGGGNIERTLLGWSGGEFFFGTEAGGTGTGTRNIRIQTNGTTRFYFSGLQGHFLALADNTYDIGASGANRARNGYFGSAIFAGTEITAGTQITLAADQQLRWGTTRSRIESPADGNFKLRNAGDTGFGLLMFGGTTSSFPALKRSAAILQARLADDSDFTRIQGIHRTHSNANAETPTATHTLLIEDASGTQYKVLAVAA